MQSLKCTTPIGIDLHLFAQNSVRVKTERQTMLQSCVLPQCRLLSERSSLFLSKSSQKTTASFPKEFHRSYIFVFFLLTLHLSITFLQLCDIWFLFLSTQLAFDHEIVWNSIQVQHFEMLVFLMRHWKLHCVGSRGKTQASSSSHRPNLLLKNLN